MCVWVQRKWKKKYSEQKYKRKKRDDILNLSQSQILCHVARSWGTQRELHLVQWITQAVAICRCTDCYFFSFSLSRHLEKNKIKISTQNKTPPVFPFPKTTTPVCFKAQHFEFSTSFLKPFAKDLDLQGLANHFQH